MCQARVRIFDTCWGIMPLTAPCLFTGYRCMGRYLPGVIWWAVAFRTREIRGVRDTMVTWG